MPQLDLQGPEDSDAIKLGCRGCLVHDLATVGNAERRRVSRNTSRRLPDASYGRLEKRSSPYHTYYGRWERTPTSCRIPSLRPMSTQGVQIDHLAVATSTTGGFVTPSHPPGTPHRVAIHTLCKRQLSSSRRLSCRAGERRADLSLILWLLCKCETR